MLITLLFSVTTLSIAGTANLSCAKYLPPVWNERTGVTLFAKQIDQLFSTADSSGFYPPVYKSGPAEPYKSANESALIDLQGVAQFFSGQNSRQLPASVLSFRPATAKNSNWRWQLFTGFRVSLPNGFYLHQRTTIDSAPDSDPISRTKEYRQIDASVEVPTAVLGYQHDRFKAWVGRQWEIWGPGWTGSLVFDAQYPAADGFGLSWQAKRWAARFQLGRIDDHISGTTQQARYLAGHRIDMALADNLRVGLSETALVASSKGMPLWLANPLLPWVLAEQEDRSAEPTNILWAIDAIWNPTTQISCYAQFLLDDFMVDLEDRDTYPDQLGVLAGTIYCPISDNNQKLSFGVEYSRLGSWTYVHRDRQVRYRAWSGSPGHPAGPDTETVSFFATHAFPRKEMSLAFLARWHQQGNTWLNTPETSTGSAMLPFPSEPVFRWWQFALVSQAVIRDKLRAEFRTGWTGTANTTIGVDSIVPPEQKIAHRGWWCSLSLNINLGSLAIK